jgi:hypothetical protein
MRKQFKLAAILGLLVLTSGGSAAFAQSVNAGDIRGTVTDSSGAVIPDTTVTVLNVDTGVSKDFNTNHDGVYDTASIVAGRYQVTFTKQGFQKLVRGPITVDVGFTAVNVALQVGSESVEVTVNTDVPLLHTEGGDQTSTLEAKDMDELPNVGGSNGPDWQNFMILLPGATGTYSGSSNQANAYNPGQEVSTNGNLPFSNVLADGATTTLPSSQNANPATFEDVAELQVSLSSFSAQYGIGGLVINQITKGGTDKFHGVAYEYFQNNALNAANYGFGTKQKVPFLRYDDFGGTFSGPVALPFMNLRHNAFFFFGYDQIVNNGVSSGFNTVPTAAILSGNFAGGYTLYDPTTQTIALDSGGHPYPVRQSFLSEYGCNCIPAALIDKVSANFEQYYPTPANHIPYGQFVPTATPNNAGVTVNNFYSQYPNPRPWKRYFGRLDYDITKNNRLTMSDTQGDEIESGNNSVTACPIGCQIGDVDNNNAQITDVWNISPHLINEARMGYTDQLNFFADAGTNTGLPAKLGWKYAKADVLPAVQFLRNYPYAWIQPATNASYKEFVFDPSDVVTMIRGKHILHFGGEFAIYRDDTTNWGNINAGTLQFSGAYTENWTVNSSTGLASANTTSGEEYADFLLGYASNWSASVVPEYGVRLKKPQIFVQDDIKLRPNLTVNLGLRYEINHGYNEIRGNEATFDPTVTNPATGTPGAYWYGSTHTNGRTSLQANVFNTVLPRAGFAWLAHPNSTVRGGFGLYTYNFSSDNYGSGLGAAVSSSGGYGDQSSGIYPVTKFDGTGTLFPLGGGTVAPLPYTAASTNPARFNGQGASYNQYHTPIPKIFQWNLGIEQQIGTNIAATLSYVGSHGFNLTMPSNINAVPETALFSGNTSGCGKGSTVNCYRPYPIYQSINGNLYIAISNYHSLQATITKRLSNGFSTSFNYTWSHMLDDQDSSGWGTHAGPQPLQHESTLTVNRAYLNYGPSNFDVRNSFKGYAVYDLPFGHGRQFLNKSWLVDETLGGLQISGTVVIASGNPFTVYATDPTYAGASQYPNKTGASVLPPGGRTIANWYNPAAFSDPGPGQFGNAGRNSLVGPGFWTSNISALKAFDLPWERMRFSVRVDASNAFNHPTFGAPTGTLAYKGGTPVAGTIYNATNAGAQGQITSVQVGGRNVQIGARLSF